MCLLPFSLLVIFSKKHRRDTLTLAIMMLLFVLVGKIVITVDLWQRRLIVSIPLAFLLMGYAFSFSWGFFAGKIEHASMVTGRIKQWVLEFLKRLPLSFFIFVCYVLYFFPMGGDPSTLDILFHPTYNELREARQVASVIDTKSKVLFLDGCFGYLAIALPNKFIDMPPDISMEHYYMMETNPTLTVERLGRDPSIRYATSRANNPVRRKILERYFNAKVISDNVTREKGLLYEVPR